MPTITLPDTNEFQIPANEIPAGKVQLRTFVQGSDEVTGRYKRAIFGTVRTLATATLNADENEADQSVVFQSTAAAPIEITFQGPAGTVIDYEVELVGPA